jgi:hypothetical protein
VAGEAEVCRVTVSSSLAPSASLRASWSANAADWAATLWCSAAVGLLAGEGFALYGLLAAVLVIAANTLAEADRARHQSSADRNDREGAAIPHHHRLPRSAGARDLIAPSRLLDARLKAGQDAFGPPTAGPAPSCTGLTRASRRDSGEISHEGQTNRPASCLLDAGSRPGNTPALRGY